MPPEVFYGCKIKLLYRYGFQLLHHPYLLFGTAQRPIYNNCTKQTQYLNKLDNTLIIPDARLKRVVWCVEVKLLLSPTAPPTEWFSGRCASFFHLQPFGGNQSSEEIRGNEQDSS